jgi:ATP-dependent DNA helicase RecG
VHLSSSIHELYKGKKLPASIEKLKQAGKLTIEDLLWIFPIKIYPAPKLSTINYAQEGQLFKGQAKILTVKSSPSYTAKGKRGIRLFNVTATIQDDTNIMLLRWFNCYPTMLKKIKTIEYVIFEGEVSKHGGSLQVINPRIIYDLADESDELIVTYPTINGVNANLIKNIIKKIPAVCWELANDSILRVLKAKNIYNTFEIMHGRLQSEHWTDFQYEEAKTQIIYYEFFLDQIKILIRKSKIKNKIGIKLTINDSQFKLSLALHPFQLTQDQINCLNEIRQDVQSGISMMRMIQGDVGCGKTAVAISTCYYFLINKYQCALMAPTETLARQHYINFKMYLADKFKIELLLGSHTQKEKKQLYEKLKSHEIDLIIGTHSLFQNDVTFKTLGLAIIDEQHKFGVNQRIKLLNKGLNTHCLIMTATPIPRTLRLTQYGDLDISTISHLPNARKGIKTRIVTQETEKLYLSFIKTRLELNEQIFIVVPAIEESEHLELKNIEQIYIKYKKLFNSHNIATLHGKMKSEDKDRIIQDFTLKKTSILITTSVIEVGIDIPNATVISIYGAERFGLSSLHQLRGRVGRGDKTGFCFLMATDSLSDTSLTRLKVLEQSTDGFYIAEKDLEFRGEGDLFGTDQAGLHSNKKLANIFYHRKIFDQVIQDINHYKSIGSPLINDLMKKYINDDTLSSTI